MRPIIVEDRRSFGHHVRHRRKVPFDPRFFLSRKIALFNRDIFELETELNRYLLAPKDHFELISEAFASNIVPDLDIGR